MLTSDSIQIGIIHKIIFLIVDGDELEAGKVASNQICIENDKEYKIDQYIRSGEPCKTCRCVPGFNGLNENSCREIHCVVDNRIGCVPVYVDGVCCPISYKCGKCLKLKRKNKKKTKILN